jgi:hypothetical protein
MINHFHRFRFLPLRSNFAEKSERFAVLTTKKKHTRTMPLPSSGWYGGVFSREMA